MFEYNGKHTLQAGHHTTCWKVTGSIPDEVTEFFSSPFPSSPEVDLAANRNEHQPSFWELKSSRRVRLTASPPSVCRVSRKSGSFNISQSYGPPRPGTGIALHFSFCINRQQPHSGAWGVEAILQLPDTYVLILICLRNLVEEKLCFNSNACGWNLEKHCRSLYVHDPRFPADKLSCSG
jgi:hypothetical protein